MGNGKEVYEKHMKYGRQEVSDHYLCDPDSVLPQSHTYVPHNRSTVADLFCISDNGVLPLSTYYHFFVFFSFLSSFDVLYTYIIT